jgi:mannose-6-phosphate isomerase-like protein (cupin superfamily)
MTKRICVTPKQGGLVRMRLEEIRLAPGEEAAEASGVSEESFYYVVSGYGRFGSDVYGYALEPQMGVFIPARTEHVIANTGGVECVLVRYGFGV